MTMLGDDFRRRAEKNNATAEELFASAKFASSPKVQASAVIAKVTANFLYIQGELVDYLRMSDATDAASARRMKYAEQNEAMRNAYVAGVESGDFTEYDRLLAEFGASFETGEPDGDGSSPE